MFKPRGAHTLLLDGGRICLIDNAAERPLRCISFSWLAWLFCGCGPAGSVLRSNAIFV